RQLLRTQEHNRPASDRPAAYTRTRRQRRFHVEGLEERFLLAVTITEFPISTDNASPNGITVGPDGNLWFAEEFGKKIGMINPTTHAITDFLISTSASPTAITAGPDGNL